MENWVHIEPILGTGDGTVSITLDANDSTESRTTTVDVSTSTLNKQLSITQKGLDMIINSINIDYSTYKVFFNGEEQPGSYLYKYLTSGVMSPNTTTDFICHLFVEGNRLEVVSMYIEDNVIMYTAPVNPNATKLEIYTITVNPRGYLDIT